MELFRRSVNILSKRRSVFLYILILTAVYCLFEAWNPVLRLLFGFSKNGIGDIFQTIMTIIQYIINFFSNSKIGLIVLLVFLLLLIAASALIALISSGCSNILNNALDGKPKFSGEFVFGVKKYFLRQFLMTLRVMFLGLVFVIFLVVLSVPAIVISEAYISGRFQFLLAIIFIDFITLAVIFFGLIFFRIYALFWFPSSVVSEQKAFIAGKNTVDSAFWKIVGRIVIFDIIFWVLQSIFMWLAYIVIPSMESYKGIFNFILYIFNVGFKTIFFTLFISYIFTAFKTYSEKAE